jgi:hypothetical protein
MSVRTQERSKKDAGSVRPSAPQTAGVRFGPAIAFVAGVTLAAVWATGPASAEQVTPLVSPDRIEDVPSTRVDPFPDFDNFAWRAFIALNWPARLDAERGIPDPAKSLGNPGPRVWETFKSRYELFEVGPNGRLAAPAPWASYGGRNPCGADVDNHTKTLASFVPFAEFNQASFTPGVFANPLIAQTGAYTRYETRVNEPEFSTLATNGWSRAKNLPDEKHPARIPVGAIAVKAAWRPLTSADTPALRARYYVAKDAEIVDVAKTLAAGRVVCSKSDIALVGFHIAIKTKYRPQWLWSTFEHVDNVPPVGAGEAREPDAKDAGAPYSYFDASKADLGLWPPLGTQTVLPVDWSNPPKLNPEPMQVVRRHPIHASTMAMNQAYWAAPGVRGTVWEHYMLVAAQWPTVPQPPGPQNNGGYFPGLSVDPDTPRENYQTTDADKPTKENLVNTTIETYFQEEPSSCMACHHAVSNAHGRDFVGILAGVH